jgi:hypothetical protein
MRRWTVFLYIGASYKFYDDDDDDNGKTAVSRSNENVYSFKGRATFKKRKVKYTQYNIQCTYRLQKKTY